MPPATTPCRSLLCAQTPHCPDSRNETLFLCAWSFVRPWCRGDMSLTSQADLEERRRRTLRYVSMLLEVQCYMKISRSACPKNNMWNLRIEWTNNRPHNGAGIMYCLLTRLILIQRAHPGNKDIVCLQGLGVRSHKRTKKEPWNLRVDSVCGCACVRSCLWVCLCLGQR